MDKYDCYSFNIGEAPEIQMEYENGLKGLFRISVTKSNISNIVGDNLYIASVIDKRGVISSAYTFGVDDANASLYIVLPILLETGKAGIFRFDIEPKFNSVALSFEDTALF